MGKRNIYWWIQQIDDIGGTEMVSINLANHLSNKFNITLLVTSEIKNQIVYKINPNIKIINLGFKKEFVRFDQSVNSYRKNHKYIKLIRLVIYSLNTIIFRKGSIRKRIRKFIKNKDDVLIASSFESYMFSPKVSKLYFHFHFDHKTFFSFVNRFALRHSKKPDKFIFLSKSIMDKIIDKKNKYKLKSIAIINPVRFTPTLNLDYHNNNLIFVGRYVDQKDPILALKITKELKKRNIPFHLNMYGKGSYLEIMQEYVKENELSSYVTINSPVTNIENVYRNADLLLMTSRYEGFGLSKVEANSFSVPCVLRNWGPSVNDVATNKESLIIDGDNPIEYADKIVTLLTSNKLNNYKKESYEYCKKFDINNIIQEWEKLFSE